MKIKTKSISMFKCLYLESLIGMVITFFIFLQLSSNYLLQDDKQTFVDTAVAHLESYVNSQPKSNGLYERLSDKNVLSFYDYNLKIIDQVDGIQQYCLDCDLLSQHQDLNLYINSSNLFFAVLSIPDSHHLLLFSEIENPITILTPWYEDRDKHFFFTLFITMSLALAALLYLPLRRVNKRINKLLKVQESFGQGDLSVRAESYHISPIKEIAQSFNEMAEDIETRVKESQIFSQAIPHEIRTPLSRIQMASDLLRRSDTINRRMLHDRIDDYIKDISLLTSDIIQLSLLNNKRCTQNIPNSDEISLSDLCQQRIELMSHDSDIQLNIDSNLSTLQPHGSYCFAKLTLDNLIKNAMTYGKGVVEISLNEFDCSWSIDVEDNGDGVPEEKRNEIFLAFSRLDKSRNLNKGGFGLGLAIASQATKNLGWKLSVDDSHLGGARFTLIIPKPSF